MLLPSVVQALDIARRSGGRVQISHLAAVGRRKWGTVLRALELVDAARAEGVDAGVDIYPYRYGNAPLAQLLPAWAQEGGPDAMARRLREDDVRARVRAGWRGRAVGWDEIAVSWVPPGSSAESLIGQAISSDDQALDLLAEHTTQVLIIAGGRSEDDLRAVLAHPATVVASDGLCLDPGGVTGAGSGGRPRSRGAASGRGRRHRGVRPRPDRRHCHDRRAAELPGRDRPGHRRRRDRDRRRHPHRSATGKGHSPDMTLTRPVQMPVQMPVHDRVARYPSSGAT
jgi:N-acyl-D-amino-acid deacylase